MQEPMNPESNFHMIDVGNKVPTRRRAIAKGQIHMAPEIVVRIKNKDMPKGDVLALAEATGIIAAKKTSDLLPLCHPLPIEAVSIQSTFFKNYIEVTAEVITTAKTGVEMEALSSVSAALLCIYDLTKIVDPALSISGIYLDRKEGGKSGIWTHPQLSQTQAADTKAASANLLSGIKSSVVVISDRCSLGQAQDLSGEKLKSMLNERGAVFGEKIIVPDEKEKIENVVLSMKEKGCQLLILTGGTGIGPRDVTPEALENIWTKKMPGFGELLRSNGAQYTFKSYMSRSEAGLVGEMFVVMLPGSTKAVEQGLSAIEKLIPHALKMIQGEGH